MNRIHQLLDNKPDNALAVVDFDGRKVTYRQLADISEQLARMLAAHGLRTGDRIVSIDAKATAKLGFGAAIEAIRGLAGTPVRLQVKRGQQVFDLDIIRQEVTVPKG